MNSTKEEMIIHIALFAKNSSKKRFTISELCNSLQVNKSHPYLYEWTRILKEQEIIKVVETFGTTKIYAFNQKRLRDYIDELPITNLFYDYFNKYHWVGW